MNTDLASLSGRAVLLVEDDYFIARQMRRGLEGVGAQVLGPACTLEDGLDLARTSPRIDAALLDIDLQGEKAFPIADLLRERGVPFAFATGYDGISVPERYDAVMHCCKPVDVEAVIRILAPADPSTEPKQ
ncbi:response regulator [Methylobacterium sp. 17Sr1-1]|uniref:response regulator n=1 Tax=Methylobacterium sp. 17Sr1-1 TaxID=2202826 RepID=UPI0026D95751